MKVRQSKEARTREVFAEAIKSICIKHVMMNIDIKHELGEVNSIRIENHKVKLD